MAKWGAHVVIRESHYGGSYAVAKTSLNDGGVRTLLNSKEIQSILSGIVTRGAAYANSLRSPDTMANRPYEYRVFTGRNRAHGQIFEASPHGARGDRKDLAIVKGLLSGGG